MTQKHSISYLKIVYIEDSQTPANTCILFFFAATYRLITFRDNHVITKRKRSDMCRARISSRNIANK